MTTKKIEILFISSKGRDVDILFKSKIQMIVLLFFIKLEKQGYLNLVGVYTVWIAY